ncbi:hypothetical protein N7488_000318 [Penicillium malachiteum]|nr:hypothetical protein N7488_000318 [Penicillium malachiteum]
MPTAKYFAQVPPFPSDRHLVALPKVSLQKLHNTAAEESQLLFEACQNWGFFLLDLQDSQKGKELLGLAEKMFDLTNKTFYLDQSVLDSYAPRFNWRKGQLKTDDGKMDRMDLYSINQDDILGNRPPRRNADTIEAKRSELRQFIETFHAVIAPGEQALVDLLSVAYLVRPKNSASMRRLKGAAIPQLEENENDETRSVNEWAAWRTKQIILGQLKPQTRDGKLVGV